MAKRKKKRRKRIKSSQGIYGLNANKNSIKIKGSGADLSGTVK